MTDFSPDTFLVQILGVDGRPVGVGTLVTDQHIVTCAHVVNVALGLDIRAQGQPIEVVAIDFPLLSSKDADSQPYQATVVRWLPPPRDGARSEEIAGLQLLDRKSTRLNSSHLVIS